MKKIFTLLLLASPFFIYAQPKLVGTLGYSGAKNGGSVFRYDLPGTSPGIVYPFDRLSPNSPSGGVSKGDGNWLYGITGAGGINNAGAFYRIQQNGTLFTKLYDFISAPNYNTIPYYHTDGMVYFTENSVVRKYNTAGGSITTVYSTNPIQSRNLHIDSDDWIYFTESGFPARLVKVKTDGLSFTVLHDFNISTEGDQGIPGVTEIPGDTLFGLQMNGGTNNGGTIYSIKKDGTGFIVHHQFTDATGMSPNAKLVYFDGKLYGTTLGGGNFNEGVLFCINSDGSNYRVLRHLEPGSGGWTEATLGNISISSNGRIFGVFRTLFQAPITYTNYRLFKVDTSGSNFEPFFTGSNIGNNRIYGERNQGLLLVDNETVFFTTYSQGRHYGGVLNTADTVAGETDLYHFGISPNGFRPLGGVIKASDGKLYGTTTIGGASGNGVIYSMNADGTGYTRLHEFTDAEGYEPSGKLLEASDGKLYGACRQGGPNNLGILYRMNKNGTGFEIIYDYSVATGGYSPVGSLVEDAGGVLYGANFWYPGSVFKINKDGSNYTELKVFTSVPGEFNFPYNGLTLKENYLYGAAGYGGASNKGGLFRIKTDGTSYQVLHEFTGTDGELPVGTPIVASNGKLYGTTAYGGSNSNGTIYRIDATGTNFTILRDLVYTDGTNPWTGLIQASDGLLYGGTQIGGSSNDGTLFKINLDGSGFSVIQNFNYVTEGQGMYSLIDLNGSFVVLTVQFISFTAQKRGESVVLSWKTASERNSSRFEVERSVNGTAFTTIGTVAASGNTSSVVSYSFNDMQPVKGTNFYRLKQVDVDGTFDYSVTVSIKFDKNGTVILSPNPVKNVLNIQLQQGNQFTSASVFDATGKLISKQNITGLQFQITTQNLPKGWYTLRLDGKESEQHSFIKQ